MKKYLIWAAFLFLGYWFFVRRKPFQNVNDVLNNRHQRVMDAVNGVSTSSIRADIPAVSM